LVQRSSKEIITVFLFANMPLSEKTTTHYFQKDLGTCFLMRDQMGIFWIRYVKSRDAYLSMMRMKPRYATLLFSSVIYPESATRMSKQYMMHSRHLAFLQLVF